MKSSFLLVILPVIIGGLLFANSALTDLVYDSSKSYSAGDAVIPTSSDFTLYTAKTTVPAGSNGPPNSTYWQTAEDYSTQLQSTYSSTVSTPPSSANINTSEIAGLSTPPATGTTTPSAQILGISIRGGVFGSVMSGSLTLGGTSEAKNVLFRVKGPSMNFGGSKLANPTIKALSKASGSWQTLFEANDFGDHSSAASYSDRGTGNALEPIAVIAATPGTFSCQMNAEDGGTGNANMEIKGFEDENSSTYFQGISMRGYIGDYPMSGSLTIVGTGSVDVMFRVKGPSMNFGGEKLADPKIKLLQKVNGTWTTLVDSSSFGDHSSSTTYADRATGNSLEPMVVLSLQAGTYSCQASSDIDGGKGNANMEIKLVE